MPELPEVETTLRGIEPYVSGSVISDIVVRNPKLRWPVPQKALAKLIGQRITAVERRAKYILLHTSEGTVLLHLGMSGSICVLKRKMDAGKHDHLDIVVKNGRTKTIVRLNDPRRFGCCLVLQQPVYEHKLLNNLGPEPLSDVFDANVLFKRSRGRSLALKNFIMDGKVVVGVGNIYASEALFLAGIRPTMAAGRLNRKRCHVLAQAIKKILSDAIVAGGTTLSDYSQTDGKPGYFKQELKVYGRAGEPCDECGSTIKSKVIGQRNTFFCSHCQVF